MTIIIRSKPLARSKEDNKKRKGRGLCDVTNVTRSFDDEINVTPGTKRDVDETVEPCSNVLQWLKQCR